MRRRCETIERRGTLDFFKDQSAIVLFVLLFMPGFVATRVYDLLVPGAGRDYGKAIYEVIGYSFLTYAVWSWLLIPLSLGPALPVWGLVCLAILILIVTPGVLPVVYLKVARRFFASSILEPYPSSWDWAFKTNKDAMVLVHLRDGRKVGGSWLGSAFSSSYPVPPDLFLSEVWHVEQDSGRFLYRAQDSKGLLLWGSDIEMVEFFDTSKTVKEAHERLEIASPP
jgi:hypothetical protein